eukprot:4206888-Pleurochrysis_carterae.AAC.3
MLATTYDHEADEVRSVRNADKKVLVATTKATTGIIILHYGQDCGNESNRRNHHVVLWSSSWLCVDLTARQKSR